MAGDNRGLNWVCIQETAWLRESRVCNWVDCVVSLCKRFTGSGLPQQVRDVPLVRNSHISIRLSHELTFPARKLGMGRWPIVHTVAVRIPAGVLRATLRFNGLRMMYGFGVATNAGVLRTKLHSSVEHNTRRANERPFQNSAQWCPMPLQASYTG